MHFSDKHGNKQQHILPQHIFITITRVLKAQTAYLSKQETKAALTPSFAGFSIVSCLSSVLWTNSSMQPPSWSCQLIGADFSMPNFTLSNDRSENKGILITSFTFRSTPLRGTIMVPLLDIQHRCESGCEPALVEEAIRSDHHTC